MKIFAVSIALLLTTSASAAAPASGFPFTDEDLNYSINWASGLSLGESHIHAKRSGSSWTFELDIDASIPGFVVKDVYRAAATADFCSTSFDRTTSHGPRKAQEKETISGNTVTRNTLNGGGDSQLAVSACVKDALTLLYYARRELGQGRVPQAQQVVMGGLYQLRLDYAGAQMIQVGETSEQSDKVVCTVKGTASDFKFEIYFARDAARTPLLFKAPFPLGTFSMELVR